MVKRVHVVDHISRKVSFTLIAMEANVNGRYIKHRITSTSAKKEENRSTAS